MTFENKPEQKTSVLWKVGEARRRPFIDALLEHSMRKSNMVELLDGISTEFVEPA